MQTKETPLATASQEVMRQIRSVVVGKDTALLWVCCQGGRCQDGDGRQENDCLCRSWGCLA